jgi:pyruvate,water dikinase
MLFLMDTGAIAEEFEGLDAAAAEVLRAMDPQAYRLPEKPAFLQGILAAGLWRSAGLIGKTVEGLILPDRFDRHYREGTEAYVRALDAADAENLGLKDYYLRLTSLAVDLMLNVTIPTLIDAEMAKTTLRKLFAGEPDEIRKRADMLDRALPHNLTTEMGLEIASLARMFPPGDYDDIPTLANRVRAGSFPAGGSGDWARFMQKFGFRGPLEIDLASPRFCEDPAILLSQMRTFSSLSPDMDPSVAFMRQKSEREEAAEFLQNYLDGKSRIKAMEFRKLYQVLVMFGGYRESHKYFLVMASFRVRQRILAAARELAARDRIADTRDVFFLTIGDLATGLADPSLDLKARVEESRKKHAPFMAVPVFPALIDSRGTILRPPRPRDMPGRFFGDAVSAGIIRGPVKVLHSAGEKPVNPGDILVIHAADPGWTPLFIAAGGIVLEVGGMLQHGSIIAREYGKPCIAGITGVLDKFSDGQMVEVDGAAGSVRILD